MNKPRTMVRGFTHRLTLRSEAIVYARPHNIGAEVDVGRHRAVLSRAVHIAKVNIEIFDLRGPFRISNAKKTKNPDVGPGFSAECALYALRNDS